MSLHIIPWANAAASPLIRILKVRHKDLLHDHLWYPFVVSRRHLGIVVTHVIGVVCRGCCRLRRIL